MNQEYYAGPSNADACEFWAIFPFINCDKAVKNRSCRSDERAGDAYAPLVTRGSSKSAKLFRSRRPIAAIAVFTEIAVATRDTTPGCVSPVCRVSTREKVLTDGVAFETYNDSVLG